MARILRFLFMLLLASAGLVPLFSAAQAPSPDAAAAPAPPPTPLPQDKLDALLAPIALYPDQLLGQVLMASTYPLEVVEAARFAEQNRELKGDALENALKDKTWDPSVISLATFPQVLAMMNDKLEWTQQLGDAFLANEPQVMQTVQALRQKAQAAGNLQTTPQQTVVVKENYIYVEPAQPQTVFVPVYNPTVVYGTWWWPSYRPWYWYPPPYYGYGAAAVGVGIAFGAGYALGRYNWGWSNPNWRGGNINVNINNNYYSNRYRNYNNQNGNWQHNPENRRGVAYRDTNVQNRYQRPTTGGGAQTREAYRGYDQTRANAGNAQRPTQTGARPDAGQAGGRPNAGSMQRPTSTAQQPSNRQSFDRPTTSPAYSSRESRPQVQQQSQRGAQSRQTMNPPTQSSRPTSTGGGARGGGGGARGGGGGGGGGRR